MHRLKFLGLLLVALCFAALATAAMAAPPGPVEMLPGALQAFAGTNVGNTKLVTLANNSVECKGAKGNGTIEQVGNNPAGTFKITFETCESIKPVKSSCGNIVTEGTFKVVRDVNLKEEYAILFTLGKEVSFECLGGFVKIKVKAGGQVLCLILKPTESNKSHEFHCKEGATTGEPEETKYWLFEGGKEVEHTIVGLLTSVNGGAFESSAQVGLGTVVTATNAVAFMN